MLAITN